MTHLHKKIVLVLFAAITIAALLLPAPKVSTHVASLDATTQPAVQETAGLITPWIWDSGNERTTCGYTWAG